MQISVWRGICWDGFSPVALVGGAGGRRVQSDTPKPEVWAALAWLMQEAQASFSLYPLFKSRGYDQTSEDPGFFPSV